MAVTKEGRLEARGSELTNVRERELEQVSARQVTSASATSNQHMEI